MFTGISEGSRLLNQKKACKQSAELRFQLTQSLRAFTTRIIITYNGQSTRDSEEYRELRAMKERSKNPATKKIAAERIGILFEQAESVFHDHPDMSNRYVELARKIAMRQRIRIDREYRRRYCHHCYVFLVPGNNMRVRVHRGNVVVTCRVCNKTTRYRVVRPHVGSE